MLLVILLYNFSISNAFDTEIDSIRQEGFEKHDISIFVEERVEFIHSRVQLQPLLSSIEYSRKASLAFSAKANTSLGKILSNKLMRSSSKLEKRIDHMYESSIYADTRRKRAIEAIGNLISSLFGNPGPEDWKQNTKNILAMKGAIERQMENSQLLHKDIDQNRHAINEQNEILRHISKEVINSENRLNTVDDALNELESYLELESMYTSITEIIESLDAIRSDAKTGRCNEKGLNREFLIEHLRAIESNKDGIAPLFASWEYHKYYKYELCSVALHKKDVWITLRIPVVNLAEQLVRTIPTSSQLWFIEFANDNGLDTSLFKAKNSDTFMLATKNNLETCSKLGTSRVCSIRKTKFKEANPFIVPIDIDHDRILILSNVTKGSWNAKSSCKSETNSLMFQGQTVIRLPQKCALVARSFEIARAADLSDVVNALDIGHVDKIEMRQITLRKNSNSSDIPMISNLETDDNKFRVNNNQTRVYLDHIHTSTTNMHISTLIFSTTGAAAGSIFMTGIAILFFRCLKARERSNVDSPVVVVVDEESKKRKTNKLHNSIELPNSNDDLADSELHDKQSESNDEWKTENAKADNTIRKPPFQQKK